MRFSKEEWSEMPVFIHSDTEFRIPGKSGHHRSLTKNNKPIVFCWDDEAFKCRYLVRPIVAVKMGRA